MDKSLIKNKLITQISPSETLQCMLDSPQSFFLKSPNSLNFKDKNSEEFFDDLKMPLIFFPKHDNHDYDNNNKNNNMWNNIATDILRSIHSEHSFAKKSNFGFKQEKSKISSFEKVRILTESKSIFNI